MASVLAIASKAVFEKLAPKAVPGELIANDRYVSAHKAFASLESSDAIFVVTVRPPGEKLWLIAIIEGPTAKGGAYIGAANATRIVDITKAVAKLTFSTGTGLAAKKGRLGMSLQTPRILSASDVSLLRGLAAKAPSRVAQKNKRIAKPVEPALAKKAARYAANLAAKAVPGTGLRLENYRRPLASIATLGATEKTQLVALLHEANLASLEEAVETAYWHEMELVDVVDVTTSEVRFQFYLWPEGRGALLENATTKRRGGTTDHLWEQVVYDPALLVALAVAFHNARRVMKIRAVVEFGP